jgi:hypothetical protein
VFNQFIPSASPMEQVRFGAKWSEMERNDLTPFASDAFPTFWRENATDATETTNKRISSAIVERSERF